MNKSNGDSNLTYAELTKIENEQNWTFVRLLIALSVGVLAFSLESYESNQNSDWIIKISWGLLLLSSLSGILSLFFFQKKLSQKSKHTKIIEENENEANKEVLENHKKKIRKFDRYNEYCSYILLISFMLGIIFFVLFKFLNLW